MQTHSLGHLVGPLWYHTFVHVDVCEPFCAHVVFLDALVFLFLSSRPVTNDSSGLEMLVERKEGKSLVGWWSSL